MVSPVNPPDPSPESPMPQAHTAETLAPARDDDDRLSRLLFVSSLSGLSIAGVVFFVSDIVELFQVLVVESGVRYL